MKSYGINSPQEMPAANAAAEEVQREGYTILHAVMNEAELAEARQRLDAVLASQVAEFGAGRLDAIQEADLARCLLAYDDWFIRLAAMEPVSCVISALLGSYHLLNLQNGIINRPHKEHHQTSWHRDLPYQNWVCTKPLAVNALFCIDDFKVETGGTVVLPRSHRFEQFPSTDQVEMHELTVCAEAGSVIIFDAMMYHRAGANVSPHIRRGINHMFTIPLLKQQISIPAALRVAGIEPPVHLRRLLGYEAEEPESALVWRQRRWEKAQKA